MKSIKKMVSTIGAFLVTLSTKIFASSNFDIRPDAAYGIPKPTDVILRFLKPLVIPIALGVGLVVYIKKSNNSKMIKFIISILVVTLAILAWFLISRNV